MEHTSIDAHIQAVWDSLERVAPDDLAAELEAGALVVDIRGDDQRRDDGPVPGAVVIQRNVLEWRLDPASDHRLEQRPEFADVPNATTGYDRRIVLICNEGYQSALAAVDLRRFGLTNVTDLAGGFQAWASRTSGRQTGL